MNDGLPPIENMTSQDNSEQNEASPDAHSNSHEEGIKIQVCKKIDQWKTHLLDLTRRNRLLYFKPTRLTTVPIVSPLAQEIITKLVKKGRALRFPVSKDERQIVLPGLSEEKRPGNIQLVSDVKTERSGDIETSLEPPELERKLYRLRRDWRTWQEEQGIHTLFLAIGILQWKESPHEQEECLAPLILLPVSLKKEGSSKPYLLEFVEEDIVVNPVLNFKLEVDYGILLPGLPEDMDEFEVSKYLREVAECVQPQGWSVSEDVWLGRFSFEKFVMYKDLDDYRDEASNHSIVAALAGANPLSPPADVPGLDMLDESVNVQEVFPVLDADSSQLEVLVRAREGQNIVVQGPPGTGKSQTIANLIAQALRDGKKVLFVSEKMAALEVVYRRVRKLGLAFACLEVHSHRSNKAKVIGELGTTLQQRREHASPPSDAGARFTKLTDRRDSLNRYVLEVHKPRGVQQLTAYQVHGKIAQLANMPNLEFDLPMNRILELSHGEHDKLLSTIRRLAQVSEVVDNHEGHPWSGAQIDPETFSLQQRDRLLNAVESLSNAIDSIEHIVQPLVEQVGLVSPNTLNETDEFIDLLDILSGCQLVPSSWYTLDANRIHGLIDDVTFAKAHAENLSNARNRFFKRFQKNFLEQPVEEIIQRFSLSYKLFFRWFKASYWREMKHLRHFWIGSGRMTYRAALEGLKAAVNVQDEEDWFNKKKQKLEEALQDLYRGESSDWDSLRTKLEWTERLLKWFSSEPLPARLVQLASEPSRLAEVAKRANTKLKAIGEDTAKDRGLLEEIFEKQRIQGFILREVPFPILRSWLEVKRHPKDLDDWAEFLKACADCETSGLGEFIKIALERKVRASQLEGVFLKRLWKGWLDEVYQNVSALAEFRATRHEEIIEEFRKLDQEMKNVTVAIIQETVRKKQPHRASARVDDSQVGILLRETQKRRRHKSLRRLFAEIPDLLQELKPCLLMSPLSVASYLSKGAFHFDLVIFDEASQIPPEDAIGTILRGNQLIVAGDNKQLPPTKFFQVDIDWSEDEKLYDETLLESILDECASLREFVDSPLLWHYRSRHEELIAFSNRNFYESKLVTFPSPDVTGFSGAICFIHVPDGVYDRGGSRTNRKEAQRVIDLVVKHLRKHGRQYSLGVITLSLAQEEAVVNEWERRKMQEPDLEAIVDETSEEPFFIKALEKVQGDERDYIIISIGYGPDQDGKVHLHFGPINQAGGERRLNVAVTRARYQTTVVASMVPHQLDLARLTTQHKGVFFLQRYLEYAQQRGKFRDDMTSRGEPESEFEEAVKASLESRGLQVDAQVGCSEFRIDLAVRHPDHNNRYILGIECDGATYHRQRTARDRDRLRQEVLEELGWVIHRVWSTDWIRDPETATNSVIKRIEELRARRFIGPPAPKAKNRGQRTTDTAVRSKDSTISHRDQRPENRNISSIEKSDLDDAPNYQHTLSLPAYKPYVPPRRRSPESLYLSKYHQMEMLELIREVEAVIKQESPVHINTVLRRVAHVYDIKHVGVRIRTRIGGAIWRAIGGKKVIKRGDFLWDPNNKQVLPRQQGDAHRTIDEIAKEEWGAAATSILRVEFGLSRDALIRETARIMGYGRAGQHVRSRIEEAIDWLLEKGSVKVYGNQLTLIRKKS